MGFRFRRSWGVIPGVRFNLGMKSGSVSFGVRGLHYTVGTKGSRVTAGLPGTGLFWTKKITPSVGTPSRGQITQTQSYTLPIGGAAQHSQLAQPQTSQLAQPQTQTRVPFVAGAVPLLPTTQTHFVVPLWLVWAVLAVIVIAGLCMTAAMIGSVSASTSLSGPHENSAISFWSGN
jgi:hypothetical protein